MGGCECGFDSHQERKRWGHHELGAPPLGCLLLPYKRRVRATPPHTLVSPPFLSTRCSIPWSSAWRSPDRGILPRITSLWCWISAGSSTSAAPLDRGNGGRL